PIFRTVHAGEPDKKSSAALTAELIRQFERIRMAAARTEPERHRTRASIRSYVVQARSVVAPRKMRLYEELTLPELNGFRNERVEMPKRTKPSALNTGVIAAINTAAPRLADSDPAVYVAFLLFLLLCLRNVYIKTSCWDRIEYG